VAESVARRGFSVGQQIKALFDKVGQRCSVRIKVKLTDEVSKSLPQKLPRDPKKLGSQKLLALTAPMGLRWRLTMAHGC
jgi:hypothetical protein